MSGISLPATLHTIDLTLAGWLYNACPECGATHNDPCTYQLCPRRPTAPKHANDNAPQFFGALQ